MKTALFSILFLVALALAGCPNPDNYPHNPYVDWPTIEVDWPNSSGWTQFHLTIPFGKSFADYLSQDAIYVSNNGSEEVTTRSIASDSEIQWIGISSDEFGWDIYSVWEWHNFCYDNHRISVPAKIGSSGQFRGNIFVARTNNRGVTEISYLNLTLWQAWFGQNTQIIRSDGNDSLVVEFWLTDTTGAEGEGEGEGETLPVVLDQPDTLTATVVGQRVEFKVVATGGNLSYLWECNHVAITPNPASAGVYTDTLVIYSVGEINEGAYRCKVSNSQGSVYSNDAILTVNPESDTDSPQITGDPQSQNVNVGGSFSFSVTATGSGTLAYQWFKDGVEIAGATGASFSKSNAQLSDTGKYKVRVRNTYGEAWSFEATLSVNEMTEALKGGDLTYNASAVTLSATINPANIQFLGLGSKVPTAYGYMRFYDNYPSGPYFLKETAAANGTNSLTITNLECQRVNNDGDVVLRCTPIAIATADVDHPDGVYYGNIDPELVWFGFNGGVMPIVNNALQSRLN